MPGVQQTFSTPKGDRPRHTHTARGSGTGSERRAWFAARSHGSRKSGTLPLLCRCCPALRKTARRRVSTTPSKCASRLLSLCSVEDAALHLPIALYALQEASVACVSSVAGGADDTANGGSVHRMVYRFGKVFLENECTILGAIDGPECDSFNRSGRSPLITCLVNLHPKYR